MNVTAILTMVIIGLAAGWLAGQIWKGSGFGLLWNLVIGVAGSFLGGFLFRLLGISFHGIVGGIIAALIGALLLLFIISKIKR